MASVFYKVEIVAIAMGKGFAELEGSSLDDFDHKVSKLRKQWWWLAMIKRGEKTMMFDLNSEIEILVIVCHGGKSAKHN